MKNYCQNAKSIIWYFWVYSMITVKNGVGGLLILTICLILSDCFNTIIPLSNSDDLDDSDNIDQMWKNVIVPVFNGKFIRVILRAVSPVTITLKNGVQVYLIGVGKNVNLVLENNITLNSYFSHD